MSKKKRNHQRARRATYLNWPYQFSFYREVFAHIGERPDTCKVRGKL